MAKIIDKNIIDAVKNIPLTAQKEKWVLTLDNDEGSFFYSPRRIPSGAMLYRVTDEYSIYLDDKLGLHGIMVECYNNNFVKHHPEFKIITQKIFDSNQKKIKIVDPSKGKNDNANLFKTLFERTLITEACGVKLHNEAK